MLSDAIADIDRAVSADDQARRARAEARRPLRQAEAYLLTIEDLVEDFAPAVPEPLLTEIRRFIRPYSRRLSRSVRAAGGRPEAVLDALFEVEERIQRAAAGPAGLQTLAA